MNYNLNDVAFITLKNDISLSSFTIKKSVPIPVLIEDKDKAEDMNLESIASALIKIMVYKSDDKNFLYYKDILLHIKPSVASELYSAFKAKEEKNDYQFAEFLAIAVKNIRSLPEDYINLAVLYAKITADFQKKEDYVKYDFYDDKIKQVLDECIGKYPCFAQSYKELSAFHLRHGDIENARDFLEKFVQFSNDNSEIKEAERNIKKYNNIIDGDNQILYAYDKMMMGDSKTAIEETSKHILKNGPTWEAYFIRGWAKRTDGDFKEASKDLLESLKLDSGNAEVYNELSICTRESGDVELSKTYLDIAIDLDPENIVYLINLAFLHLNDEEFDKCRELIERARALDKEDPELLYIIKEYQEKTGETLSDVIKTEIYSDEDFEELHKKEHSEGHNHREV